MNHLAYQQIFEIFTNLIITSGFDIILALRVIKAFSKLIEI